ncbi:hypothetical protein NKH63_26455 [Mesorhizobium sp. M0960]|uniref:hypothetical protein n=1 Tax=Mesorhizobium sp. M0960 TaxID=2957035 RepID=UPI00333D32DD
MIDESLRHTVGDTVMSIMPMGTLPLSDLPVEDVGDATEEIQETDDDLADYEPWIDPPIWPTDLFATAAHIVHISGLLPYFDPDPDVIPQLGDRPMCFTLSLEDRAKCERAGTTWSENDDIPDFVYDLWDVVIAGWSQPIRASFHTQKSNRKNVPKWWKAAIELLIIADQACVGLGSPPDPRKPRWLIDAFQQLFAKPFVGLRRLTDEGAYRAKRQLMTFGRDSDPDVACVQPKNRISAVGCNMRNLTRNLAYIPHVGNVRCHWHQPINSTLQEDADALDILIIPLPFVIEDNWFRTKSTALPHDDRRPRWGNFEIAQDWLVDQSALIEMVAQEVQKAKKQLGTEYLNGVIFPEYALTEPVFNKICDRIKQIAPELEFAITGSSTNCDTEEGNFVLTAIWKNNRLDALSEKENRYLLTSRRKHHRWRLSGDQILDYNLQGILDESAAWWESHRIAQREIHFFHFRQTSVFTTMICEDLARSDPCHDILRAIGPNLLFAILMDGPQTRFRWPARYAATLADDPGTSVLTVTSLGLMDRSTRAGKYPPNSTVAMWRDESGTTRELTLDEGSRSLLLSLEAKNVVDQTLDGRINDGAWSWRYKTSASL